MSFSANITIRKKFVFSPSITHTTTKSNPFPNGCSRQRHSLMHSCKLSISGKKKIYNLLFIHVLLFLAAKSILIVSIHSFIKWTQLVSNSASKTVEGSSMMGFRLRLAFLMNSSSSLIIILLPGTRT